ncbi:unnamed protein product [Symbiodinium pilosum]|uniref:Protein kinase domain-containing protein n=1 Tax=Symbiodinium pilosum TaxID=2952 RepID=A0A812QEP2_SYMPI|nr:unnamed protein product [Symbiodinium pilosum]
MTAIKVLDVGDDDGFEEEVRVLSKFRHPNLVILMGFARNGPQRFLVYELLGGGDLFRRIQRCILENVQFTWLERISVAYDSSCGLSHLHNSTPKVFHRDIKCPNILLDRNGTAKIADFGLACCSHSKEQKVNQAAGTVGYACPHYVNRGVVTEGSEVYSFGIVLLELLTAALPAVQVKAADGTQQYHFLVTEIGNDVGAAVRRADRKAKFPPHAAEAFAALGLRCTEYQEEYRPPFRDVVVALREMLPNSEVPEPPPVRRTHESNQFAQGYQAQPGFNAHIGHLGGHLGGQGYLQDQSQPVIEEFEDRRLQLAVQRQPSMHDDRFKGVAMRGWCCGVVHLTSRCMNYYSQKACFPWDR